MFFRRIVQHLRNQEWTAIAIDFVIVVVGVFLATQVTNWNEARITHERARDVTARLSADVSEEARNYQNILRYYRVALANGERAVAILEQRQAATDEQFLIAAYRATQYLYYGHRRAVYDELLSTGEIGIVTDPDLRQAATLLFNTDVINNSTRISRESEFRQILRRAVSSEIQQALRERCGDRSLDRGYGSVTIDYPCTIGASAAEIAAAASALRAAPDVRAALRQRVVDLDSAASDLETGDGDLIEYIERYGEPAEATR